MEIDLPGPDAPSPGQYPYRFTQDDRFQYRVKIQPVAGHLEFYIAPVDTRLPAMAAERAFMGNPKRQFTSVQDPADRLDNQLKATQRAQRRIRLLCMEARVDRMFTFTIRNTGVLVPRATVLHAWDLFRRVMEKHWKNYRHVATMETHKSGQFHIHAGLSGFHNINHLRRIWHSCLNRALGRSQMLTSGSDTPGHVYVPPSKTGKRREGVKGSIAIACYIAKYVGKDVDRDDDESFNRKRYFHTKNIVVSPSRSLWLKADEYMQAIMEVARQFQFEHCLSDLKLFKGKAFIRVPISAFPPPPF